MCTTRETKIAALWAILFGVLLETGLCLGMVFTIFRDYPLINRIVNSVLVSLSLSHVASWIVFFKLLPKNEYIEDVKDVKEEKMLLEAKV